MNKSNLSAYSARGRLKLGWAAVVLIVAILGASAYAAIPAADGTIYGCYKKRNGDLRLVETSTECDPRQEVAISWKDSSTAKAADSDKLDGMDSTAFLEVGAKAADSDKLDGLDSTAFLGVGAKAADSDKLDGLDSASFLSSTSAAGGDLTGSYPNPSIAPGAITSAKIADATVGPDDLSQAVVKWASVSSFGALVGSSHPGVTAARVGIGSYEVRFSTSVLGCANFVSLEDAGPGEASADGSGTNLVRVRTWDSNGNPMDRPFNVGTFC